MSTKASLRKAMVVSLARPEVLAPQWREAFLTVPWEALVPAFFHGPSLVSPDSVDGLAAMYSDTPWSADMPTPGDSGLAHAIAAARPTAPPSLIARMLGALSVCRLLSLSAVAGAGLQDA